LVLYCSVFNAATQQGASWTRQLPPSEVAICVAAGNGWCCCCTAGGLVRVFGLGGLEVDVFHAPGGSQVLTPVGSGRKLLLVSQAPAAAPPAFVLIDVLRRRCLARGALPLRAGQALAWVGFATPHAVPCLLDSGGLLSGLSRAYGGSAWQPWCDTTSLAPGLATRRDALWPVAVQHGRLNALLLKGQGRGACAGPAFQPRPLVGSNPSPCRAAWRKATRR
jgi:hypothetical protein